MERPREVRTACAREAGAELAPMRLWKKSGRGGAGCAHALRPRLEQTPVICAALNLPRSASTTCSKASSSEPITFSVKPTTCVPAQHSYSATINQRRWMPRRRGTSMPREAAVTDGRILCDVQVRPGGAARVEQIDQLLVVDLDVRHSNLLRSRIIPVKAPMIPVKAPIILVKAPIPRLRHRQSW